MPYRYRALPALLLASAALAGELEDARRVYARADYQSAVRLLAAVEPKTGPVLELLGKAYYMQAEYKKATEVFEKAVAAEPSNAVYYHWLGRAYGRRAETGSPFTAPGNASKARANFEKAVSLDPKNAEALSDLFQYYLEAPGFLGGGLEKAAGLAPKMGAVDPAEFHWAMAQVAERRKQYKSAEDHFRRAMEVAPRQVGRVIDFAKFLSRNGRTDESESAFAHAAKINPNEPRLLFERAANLIKAGKDLETAKALLRKYLQMPLSQDDPSREEARKLLKAAGA